MSCCLLSQKKKKSQRKEDKVYVLTTSKPGESDSSSVFPDEEHLLAIYAFERALVSAVKEQGCSVILKFISQTHPRGQERQANSHESP